MPIIFVEKQALTAAVETLVADLSSKLQAITAELERLEAKIPPAHLGRAQMLVKDAEATLAAFMPRKAHWWSRH